MKMIGAVMILAAAALIGFSLLREKRERLLGIRSLAMALGRLRGELSTRASPLAEGIEKASSSSNGMGKNLMCCVSKRLHDLGERSFSELWNAALLESCGRLEKHDLEELKDLGAVLGRFDLELQLRALDGCISFLEDRWEKGSAAYPADRRLLLSVTLAMSSVLVILFF